MNTAKRGVRQRAMSNEDIGDVLFEVAELIEIQNGNRYRAIAFRKSGRLISALREPVAEQLKFGRLQQKTGIGAGTVERVKAILRTGTFDELERLRAQVPAGLRQLTLLKGIGPKTAKAIWQQLRISTVPELEVALLSGRLDVVAGIGARTKEKIVDAIRYSREDMGRILLPEALAIGERMIDELKSLPAVLRIFQCGSARRRRATIGDLDILVGADDKRAVATRFCMLPGVVDVLLRGDGRCSVRIERAVQVDLRVVAPETFGAGMHYFTGSQQHNIRVRTRANAKGWSVNEHGIFIRAPGRISKGGGGASEQRVGWGKTEDEIFQAVGLQTVPPELRENDGEIEDAERGRLPQLVTDRDMLGDMHVRAGPALVQTLLALKARGRQWAVVVHPQLTSTKVAKAFAVEVEAVAKETGLRLAVGAEVPISLDGAVPPRVNGVQWVVAQIPESEVVPQNDVTDALLAAISSGKIDALARPTGRVMLAHKGHVLDWERVLRSLAKHKVALEVRGHPLALDPDAATIRRALEVGVMLSISSAPQAPADVESVMSGVYEARRGWATAGHVLECARIGDALNGEKTAKVLPAKAGTAPGTPRNAFEQTVVEALVDPPSHPALQARARAFVGGVYDTALSDALVHLRPSEAPLAVAFVLAATTTPPANEASPLSTPSRAVTESTTSPSDTQPLEGTGVGPKVAPTTASPSVQPSPHPLPQPPNQPSLQSPHQPSETTPPAAETSPAFNEEQPPELDTDPAPLPARRQSVLDDFSLLSDENDAVVDDGARSQGKKRKAKRKKMTTSPAEPTAPTKAPSRTPMDAAAFGQALDEAVEGAPIEAALRDELEAFLRGDTTARVEDELRKHAENPLQFAFTLLSRGTDGG